MEFIGSVLQVIIGVVVVYYIIRRFTGSKDQIFNKKFFKYFIALLVAAIVFELAIDWMMAKPEVVTQTVEQLQADPEIRRTIGKSTGFGYNQNEISKIEKYPATVQFSLYGSKADVELSVLIDSSANVFEVKEYKVEKLTEK
ncbi:hypothetical protein AAE02nite_07800 [Adhaeribacter aerolatus]|uniref:Uncharacterized protein n=2 Tax=Adhaeribacter aerolatus TaxID=670289 RepID=A0A512ATS0_9BACT|nr:hypothetical protein AAE02nite_07800 [Adhaeribacter aerolatus]